MALMGQLGIDPPDRTGVFFGQLLGMADNLTFTLGRNGYRVLFSRPTPALASRTRLCLVFAAVASKGSRPSIPDFWSNTCAMLCSFAESREVCSELRCCQTT